MGGKSSSSSESGPWAGTQPYLRDVYAKAQGLHNQGVPGYYPGQTYNEFNPVQEQAMGATMDRAGGSATEGAFNNMLQNTLAQPTVGLGNAAGTADMAMGGLQGGMNTAAHHMQGTSTGTARQLADQGSQGWQNSLLQQSQYNGQPTASSGPGYASNALRENAGSLSMDQSNNQAGPHQSLNSTAKSRLSSLAGGNNPYLDDMAKSATDSVREQFSESVMPSLNATFSMGGRTGSRAHTDATGKAAEGLADTIANTTADIYGSNYQSDMDRRLNAADSLGSLEVNEFNANSSDDMARRGLGADLYLGSRGLSNDAARTALSDDSTRVGMGQNYDINRRGLAQDATTAGYGFQMDKNQAMQDWYNAGNDRAMDGAGMMMDAGMGGIDDITQMYGANNMAMQGAGGLVDNASAMDWNNIDRMRGVGDDVQGLSDSMLEDDINRFNYYQNAPWQMMNRYAGIVSDNAMMSSSGNSSSFNIQNPFG